MQAPVAILLHLPVGNAAVNLISVELKAVSELTDEHRVQVHNYLKATGLKLGLPVNFGHYPQLEYERIVR